jgi:hypothetical protein
LGKPGTGTGLAGRKSPNSTAFFRMRSRKSIGIAPLLGVEKYEGHHTR